MNSHLSPQIIKKTTAYDVGNPGTDLEQGQKCCMVNNWISKGTTGVNE